MSVALSLDYVRGLARTRCRGQSGALGKHNPSIPCTSIYPCTLIAGRIARSFIYENTSLRPAAEAVPPNFLEGVDTLQGGERGKDGETGQLSSMVKFNV